MWPWLSQLHTHMPVYTHTHTQSQWTVRLGSECDGVTGQDRQWLDFIQRNKGNKTVQHSTKTLTTVLSLRLFKVLMFISLK